jgi:hypothetical protein
MCPAPSCEKALATFWTGANGNLPIYLRSSIPPPTFILFRTFFGDLAVIRNQKLEDRPTVSGESYSSLAVFSGPSNLSEFRRFLNLKVGRFVNRKMPMQLNVLLSFRTFPGS